jgi:mannitol-1-/sugar-/sorbitol-6-phosphatase
VVEDAPAGVGSGKAAGCPVLAVLTTYPPETLMDANWRVPTLAGIRANPNPSGCIHLQFDSVD